MVSPMDVKFCLLRVATSGQAGYCGYLCTRLPTSLLGQAQVSKQTHYVHHFNGRISTKGFWIPVSTSSQWNHLCLLKWVIMKEMFEVRHVYTFAASISISQWLKTISLWWFCSFQVTFDRHNMTDFFNQLMVFTYITKKYPT